MNARKVIPENLVVVLQFIKKLHQTALIPLHLYIFFSIIIKTSSTGPSGKYKVVHKLLSQAPLHLSHTKN